MNGSTRGAAARLALGALLLLASLWTPPLVQAAAPKGLENAGCLSCHDARKAKIEVPGTGDAKRELTPLDARKFGRSVHTALACVDCHTDIVDSRAKHEKKADAKPPQCVSCHEQLYADAIKKGPLPPGSRLGLVVDNIKAYQQSFHARPDKERPGKSKAACDDCHATHDFHVPPKNSERRTAWHKEIPATCGAKCHEDQYETYQTSIHGEEVLEKNNMKAAVCTDCHTAHGVINTSSEKFKMGNVQTCGNCHKERLATYGGTYHGQVNQLGYGYTAKCADCHGSHDIEPSKDKKSKMFVDNRLKACQKCHSGKKDIPLATAGFVSFSPHGRTDDFATYPQIWTADKMMTGLHALNRRRAARGAEPIRIGVGISTGIGLGDTFTLQFRGGYAAHPGQETTAHVLSLTAEALYIVDILTWVPFFGAGIDGHLQVRDGTTRAAGRLESAGAAFASPVLAGDRVYYGFEYTGVMLVYSRGPNPSRIARNELEPMVATPTFAGRRMFVRTTNSLYCVE